MRDPEAPELAPDVDSAPAAGGEHDPDGDGDTTANPAAVPALILGAGVLVALSLPPWGWWPLAVAGIAVFTFVMERLEAGGASRRRRFAHAWLFAAGWMYLGMGWMVQLTVPGYLLAPGIFAVLHGVAALATPAGRWSVVGRPAAHTLVEAIRLSFPFGGVPLATLGMSQVGGPVVGVARIGGVILLTWLVFQVGAIVPTAVRLARAASTGRATADDPRFAAVPALVGAVTVATALTIAPEGRSSGDSIRIAAVQGGGEQGTSADDVPSAVVTERHLEATASIPTGDGDELGLVFWPENTIDTALNEPFVGSWQYRAVVEQAARLNTPLSVGITEPFLVDGRRRYTNAQVVVTPDGEVTSRYDKVRRVPFGEYVPFRSILERITSAVDQVGNAVAGSDPAVIDLPSGERFATVISWEVFFGGRAREGVELGGQAILNPTNGASYTGTIVQTQQVASSRLRAIETGRWVVQAAPTGYTAFVDHTGEVRQRSDQREQAVLVDTVELRTGSTWYTSLGDGVFYLLLLMVLVVSNGERIVAGVTRIRARRRA